MNVSQVTTSEGEIIRLPTLTKLEARKRRYQRLMARRKPGSNRRAKARHLAHKTARKIANVRADWQHQVAHDLSTQAGTVVVEDLNTKGMSAKGGSRKRGLGGEILATGWRGLRDKLSYKVARLVTVPAAYTGQRCHQCGHIAADPRESRILSMNRPTQARFACVSCGHEANADMNAALTRRVRPYILAKNGFSGSGIGATGRGSERQRKSALETFSLETLVSRQKVPVTDAMGVA